MKKIVLFIFVFLISLSAMAESFIVDSYSINIKVKEDSSMEVSETILVDFNSPSHGIYRDIQYRFDNPNNNPFDPVKAKVENISSPSLFKTEKSDGYYRLYLGNKDEEIIGKEEYTIKYTYSLSRDLYSSYDSLFYNIISPAWETEINNVKWTIELPKPISKDQIWVYVGEENSTKKGNYTINSTNTIISGEEEKLAPLSGLTIRTVMDEGYWKIKEEKDNSSFFLALSLLLSLLFLALTITLYYLFGVDKPLTVLKRIEAPSEINPLELSYIINGSINQNNDLCAMLFYWAEKGYITIKEEQKEKDKDYIINKEKDLNEDASKSEKALFDLIFSSNKSCISLKELAKSDFSTKFPFVITKELKEEYAKGEKCLTNRTSYILKTTLFILLVLLSVLSGILVSMKHSGTLSLLLSFIFLILFTIEGVFGDLLQTKSYLWKKRTKKIVMVSALSLPLLFIALLLIISNVAQLNKPLSQIVITLNVISLSLSALISSHIERRSEFGNEILEECLGYRDFIINCTEEELKDMENDEGEIYRKNMPYAISIGKSKVWSDKYENISIPYPSWYEGKTSGNPYLFWYLMHMSMSSNYQSHYESHISTSNGSSFSVGGGFSGGGGGSW